MIGFSISSENGLQWNLYVNEETGGFCGEYSPQVGWNIANVLRLVKSVFEDIFGKDFVDRRRSLAVLYSSDGPQTFRDNNIIMLHSVGTYYIQQIYQFSHELCHFMILGEVPKKYRWLEEAFCEMMSWYVLNRVYETRETSALFELGSIYQTIPCYVQDRIDERLDVKGASVSSVVAANLAMLQENCYLREVNSAIAYELLPLFSKRPELWKCVPFMDKLTDNETLQAALRKICNLAAIQPDIGDEFICKLCQ